MGSIQVKYRVKKSAATKAASKMCEIKVGIKTMFPSTLAHPHTYGEREGGGKE